MHSEPNYRSAILKPGHVNSNIRIAKKDSFPSPEPFSNSRGTMLCVIYHPIPLLYCRSIFQKF